MGKIWSLIYRKKKKKICQILELVLPYSWFFCPWKKKTKHNFQEFAFDSNMQCDLITLVKTFTNIIMSSFSSIFTLFASSKSHYIWLHIISTLFVLTFHATLTFGETLLFWQWDPSTYSFHWDPSQWYIYTYDSIQSQHVFTSPTSFKIVGDSQYS